MSGCKMSDQLVMCVNRLVHSSTLESSLEACNSSRHHQDSCSADYTIVLNTTVERPPFYGSSVENNHQIFKAGERGGSCSHFAVSRENELLGDCRICQEEDEIRNLEAPCACSGSLKYAHRKCVQRWCDEKGDTFCEICHEPYESGYTASARTISSDSFAIDIGGNWETRGAPQISLHDPRFLAVTTDSSYLQTVYDEYAAANESSAACCRSVALVLMALLLLRHALTMTVGDVDEDVSTFFALFLLRAAGFLLPCYIMARATSILQRQRRRREASVTAAEVNFLLQAGAGQPGGMRFAVTPGTSETS